MAADYDTAVYVEQGGAKLVVASGGEIEVQSGGTVDVQSGGTFAFGALSSTDQTGVALSSTDATVFDVFADDNNVALTNAVYHAIRGRTMLFQPPTEGSIFSVMGQIKCADEVDFNPGVFAGVRGYIETMDDTDVKSGAKVWAVEGCLDAALASYTVKSGGISAGLHAELTGVGTFTQDSTGILAGLYIDETAGTGTWGYGVYVSGATQAWYSTTTHAGAGTTIRNAMEVAVTDNATNTGNYQRGIYCNYTAAGDKTSAGEVNVFAYDLTLTGDTVYAYGYVNYIGSSGNPTLSFVAPISIYVDDLGNACSGLVGIDIGFAGTNSPADRHAYLRCRQHSSAIPQTVLLLEGSSCADYLLEATTSSMAPFDVGTGASSNCIGHIAVRFQNSGGLTRYLRLYESAS